MALDPAAGLLGVLAALLIVVVLGIGLAARARRRRLRSPEEQPVTSEGGLDVARWIDEGRGLFTLWQERIERLSELQSQLAAMAQEIGALQAQVARIDELRGELRRLGEEAERVRAERDALRQGMARIAELAREA
jgi:prefoldin subunit 5